MNVEQIAQWVIHNRLSKTTDLEMYDKIVSMIESFHESKTKSLIDVINSQILEAQARGYNEGMKMAAKIHEPE